MFPCRKGVTRVYAGTKNALKNGFFLQAEGGSGMSAPRTAREVCRVLVPLFKRAGTSVRHVFGGTSGKAGKAFISFEAKEERGTPGDFCRARTEKAAFRVLLKKCPAQRMLRRAERAGDGCPIFGGKGRR